MEFGPWGLTHGCFLSSSQTWKLSEPPPFGFLGRLQPYNHGWFPWRPIHILRGFPKVSSLI